MNEQDPHDTPGRQLWRLLGGRGAEARSACPDANDLAAYLEARLPAGERDAMEEHLSVCSDCLLAVSELRALQAEGWLEPPERVVARSRALALAREPEGRLADRESVVRQLTLRHRVVAIAVRSLEAAALVVACWAGFTLGRASFQQHKVIDEGVAAECSFGLDAAGDDQVGPGALLPEGDAE